MGSLTAAMLSATLLLLSAAARTGATPLSCIWDPAAALAPRHWPACPVPDQPVGVSFTPWTPWTYPPFCADTPYCVYTNTQFQAGHGVSLIAPPEAVQAAIPVLRDAFTAPAEQPAAPLADDGGAPRYEVQRVEGKGVGVVATRFIRRGNVFMLDFASVLADVGFPARVKHTQGLALMDKAVEQLPDPELVLTLGRSSTRGAPVAEDVLRTNTFTAKVNDKEYMALFPRISRMNHACSPNAFTNFVENRLAMRAVAFKDIYPGEEITISYSEFALTHKERQNILRRRWGFNCTCELCSSTEEEIKASDWRRKRLMDVKEEILAMVNNMDFLKAIEAYAEVMDLVQKERLAEHMGEHYEVLARFHLAANNRGSAEKYAQLAISELEEFGDSDVYRAIEELRELARSLKSYRQASARLRR